MFNLIMGRLVAHRFLLYTLVVKEMPLCEMCNKYKKPTKAQWEVNMCFDVWFSFLLGLQNIIFQSNYTEMSWYPPFSNVLMINMIFPLDLNLIENTFSKFTRSWDMKTHIYHQRCTLYLYKVFEAGTTYNHWQEWCNHIHSFNFIRV